MAGAGRIVAGTARGIQLAAAGGGTRPLSDRVKEALFAILEPDLRDARVLDLFAGSGAAGIEALSRGAAAALFVERAPEAVGAIRRNLVRSRLAPAGRVVQEDAVAWLGREGSAAGPFDVVVVDPPYDRPDLLLAVLEWIGHPSNPSILAPRGVVVAKHHWRAAPPERIGLLASQRQRRFGDTTLTFYRPGDQEEAGAA